MNLQSRLFIRCVAIAAGVVLALAPLAGQTRGDARVARDLDIFIEGAMGAGVTPGMAVAVVRDDEIIYAKGFGFSDRERDVRVTPDTQFYIASTTKSLTALTGALLAARGEIDLNTSLSRALPRARIHPQVAADQITLRDLLTHTHGIQPGGPVDFRAAFTGDVTNEQLLDVLRFHGPASTGRAFVYSNLGYNIFGLVIDTRFKEGWKAVIHREVFAPLGMRSTTASMSKTDKNRLALPYELRQGRPERVEYAKYDENMHPAGGHVSTAQDLARYLLAHINGGRIDGQQALPESAIRATHQLQVPQNRKFGSFDRFGWGLGWDLARYNGDTTLQRFGGFQGFFSHVSFMPERKVGVIVLANGGDASGVVADAVATHAYDRVLGKSGIEQRADARLAALTDELARARAALAKDLATRQARPQMTLLPLETYAGTYESPAFGRMVWTLSDGRLQVQMGKARGEIEVYNGAEHQFRLALSGAASVVTFRVAPGANRPHELQFMNQLFARTK
jgi:CubicO group peptidase (beta-lactamase class C family)